MTRRAGVLVARAIAIAVAASGCDIDPFALRTADPGDDGGSATPDANVADDGGPIRIDARPPCVPTGPDDQCDGIDNDCNGTIDDPFDKQTDGENCGACGNRCTSPGAIERCADGMCEVVDCQPGFVDLDPAVEGCEYLCPVFPTTAEDCNGVDDDCDGAIDEPAELPAAPSGLCRATPGTPCEATPVICATRGGTTTWYCDYAATVEFDPSVPNGIALEETLCDGHDGDCDGAADEPFPDLGQECDNGALGVCRDVGLRVCDPADTARTICDLSAPPAPGTATAEVCNGRDDDCNGIVDDADADGPGRVIDDMVRIQHSGLDFFIYRYEASRPDASTAAPGELGARACSRANVLPWASVTLPAARAACAASGKRLCSRAEFSAACGGAGGTRYPYGESFDPLACNAEPFDGIPGGADDDVRLPTGAPSLAACVSADAVHDLSGNLKEWTDDIVGATTGPPPVDIAVLRGGAFDTPALGATCRFDQSRLPANAIVPSVGFRCCSDAAP